MDSMVDFVQRLAATIPAPSDEQSAHETIKQLASQVATTQCATDLLVLTIVVVLALELLSKLVYHVPKFSASSSIPVRGKHLDDFAWKDWAFIGINKCMTGLFVYCYFGYLWRVRKIMKDHHHHHHEHHHGHDRETLGGDHHECCGGGHGVWDAEEISFVNTILPIPMLFITYDFFYTLLHWALHVKSVYGLIHKHHHQQKAPSRANIDAVNVHPIEFFLGEFNHILALHLVVKGMPLVGFHGMSVSWIGAVLFIALGGLVAGLNHTRHDVTLRVPSGTSDEEGKKWTVFDSKHHDVHHRIPQSNYGQYSVMWDRIFGTFREYNENDRINPAYQLDPLTGKTIKPAKKD